MAKTKGGNELKGKFTPSANFGLAKPPQSKAKRKKQIKNKFKKIGMGVTPPKSRKVSHRPNTQWQTTSSFNSHLDNPNANGVSNLVKLNLGGEIKVALTEKVKSRKRITQTHRKPGQNSSELKNEAMCDIGCNPYIVKMSTGISNGGNVLRDLCIKENNIRGTNMKDPLTSLVSAGFEVDIHSMLNNMSIQNDFQLPGRVERPVHNKSAGNKSKDRQVSKNNMNSTFNYDLKICSLPVNSSDTNIATGSVYELTPTKFLVIMKPGSYFYVIGVLELEVLKGCIEVLGYKSSKQKQKLMVFSLQGSCHLCLKASNDINQTQQTLQVPLTNEGLISLGLSDKMTQMVLKESDTNTIFIIRRKKTHGSTTVWPLFFENHLLFSIFPPVDLLSQEIRPCHIVERKLECLFEENLQKHGFKELNQISEWSTIEKEITSLDCPKVVLCGGKSVGKSTLLRFLVNKCLMKWETVLVVDFDPGQCEFTVPGCLSVTMVEDPILGPNYSHLKEPIRSVHLGEVDVTKCPEHYIEGCKSLIDYAKKKHSNIPWLINTMGFTRGIGVTFTCGIIQNISPTHVVQIESKDRKLNFPSQLDPGFVHSQNIGAFNTAEKHLNYRLHTIPSGSEHQAIPSQNKRGISPATSRNLVVLSYFSEMLTSEKTSLAQVTPYGINMKLVELQTTDKYNLTKDEIAATMNGNMVALCHLKKLEKFPNCLGFGIVRGIDWQTATLYIITPTPSHSLSKINCLVKGNIALPESLYFNQGEQVVGHIPFMAKTSGGSTARFAKRDFRTLPVTPRQAGPR